MGHPMLIPAAIDAVSQWLYRPFIVAGKPVEANTKVSVHFALLDSIPPASATVQPQSVPLGMRSEANRGRSAEPTAIIDTTAGTFTWKLFPEKAPGGPEPGQTTSGENEFLRVPYLGSWEQRRRNGFYAFEDLTKAKAVQEALKHRHELYEATRALAPLIAKRMAFWYRVRDQITEGYGGKIFEDNKSVTDAQQKKRVNVFLEWQQRVEDIILRLENQWMRIHGVDPQDPAQQWITTAALGAQVGATVQRQVSSGPMLILDGEELPLPEDISYETILLARHLRAQAETRGLPLPEDLQKAEKQKPKPPQ